MQNHIGDCFDAVISGVTNWGLYVELENTVEGLVHISKMIDDFYSVTGEGYELVGEMTGRKYSLGQRVKVKCLNVDMLLHTIDFILN